MIYYKIYKIIDDGEVSKLVDPDDAVFYTWYNSMQEAIEAIQRNGCDYIEYTILPVVRLT